MPGIPAKRDWMLAGIGLLAIAAVIVIGLLVTRALDDTGPEGPGIDIHPTAPAETPPVSSPRPVIPAE
ncbi:hypothetical protein FVA74_11170 [Salinibacterium sp. dk2585]|uniref:hypothetical protein n=1 Tax=unclassified Salinibacterium TaxID=2632331 RepID=UPI0011C24A62|nr:MULTISPECIES: hypothetical protein [unclassified Salinibacterium]QEE62064.1 hypothetical protein FVA74_11170 [Salinibacterium sp. dk2585]TXK53416.1 hypothetical protein FVP63_09440 [Salinibacterium sp. dk5596]